MAPIDRRVRLWAWMVHRQGSIASRSEAEVIALQARHTPDNALTNRIFGAVAPGTVVKDRTIPGPGGDLTVRVYRPVRPNSGGRPLIVYFHGGGFVFGDLRLGDWLCSSVVANVGAVVVSVEYRLAPRHRFPAAVDDCYAALVWAGRERRRPGSRRADGGDGGERRRQPLGGDVPAGPRPRRAGDQPAGVPVRFTEYVGMPHGYLNFPGICRSAPQALAELCAEQTAALVQPARTVAEKEHGG